MKIIYSHRFEDRYPANPVESPDRARLPFLKLSAIGYDFIEPNFATLLDIARVHGREHIENVRRQGLYDAAALAAGAAIYAADLAVAGEPAFALIRPPGHHAAANRAWGMCYFNNMAIAVQKIRSRAKRVLIIDIDLHFGDGTVSIFRGDRDIRIVNPGSVDANFDYLTMDSSGYLRQIESALEGNDFDIVGVSAGFDTYRKDWGGLLDTEDYGQIGQMIKKKCDACKAKRFALLEGGYHQDLADNIDSFIQGFR